MKEELEKLFKEYKERLDWLEKTSKRIVELSRAYEEKFPLILQKAIDDEVDFKAIYGGNTEKTRKKYVDEQLAHIVIEKENLKLFKDDDIRRIEYLKRMIEFKAQLMIYEEL